MTRLLSALLLAACAVLALSPATTTTANAEVVGITTAQVELTAHDDRILLGHIYVTRQNGQTVRALMIHQRRNGLPPLQVSEARSVASGIQFQASSSPTDGCVQDYCRDVYVGTIYLSEQTFRRAQSQGLTARLLGPTGAVRIRAPGALFNQAAQRAGRVLQTGTGI